jgi:glycosyltransferase involved in cell wall biosynthesis
MAELILQSPQHAFTLFTDGDLADVHVERNAVVRAVRNSVPACQALRAGGRRSICDIWRMSRALSAPEFDAVVFPSVFSYVPVWSRASKIVFQHDVIAETFPDLTTPSMAARSFWNVKCTAARRQADRLVTVSEYSRARIAERFGCPASRIAVVGEAPSPVFRSVTDARLTDRLRRSGIDWSRRIAVFVGGFSPHKNLLRMLHSYARVSSDPEFADVQLVLVGETENETFLSCLAEVRATCERLSIGGRVVFTGFLPDDDLVILLNRATVLLLPSLMEGFGLPAVEAATCGCPVIATKESPLPALLEDAGIYVDPLNAGQLEHALREVFGNDSLRARMRAAALSASRCLSWTEHANTLREIIEDAVHESHGHRQMGPSKGRSTKSWVRI